MNLYDVVPENLFSILASKNKNLYVKSLFVLLEAFKKQLQISKLTITTMISSTLEDEILSADFSDENLLDSEISFSGKAHFLVRKLKSTGWIMVETEADFEEYITIPAYSIRIIRLLFELTNVENSENFAYVYSTYSSLQTADQNGSTRERITALYDSADRTEKLVESIKSVFHEITYFNQQQINMISVNSVLDAHYTHYRETVVEKILRPLKIKDSVPKYKLPITLILKKWLIDDGEINSMAEYLKQSGRFASIEDAKADIFSRIYYIIETYDGLERDYISVVDSKNTQYTRATTQKIDYLINSDQTVKGNLISILKAVSGYDDEKISELFSDAFELYQCEFLGEESLFERKRTTVRTAGEPVLISEKDVDFEIRAKALAMQMLNNKFSKKNVISFVESLLDDKDEISTGEFDIPDDDAYILTLLSAVQATDRGSPYSLEYTDLTVKSGKYDVPFMTYRRRILK